MKFRRLKFHAHIGVRFPGKTPIAVMAAAGPDHFDSSDELMAFFTLFIRKAAEQRLPRSIRLPRSHRCPPNGWLVERWKLNQSRNSPPVLVAQFTGNPKNTFWCSDEEMALTTHNPVSLRSAPLDYDITFQVGTLFITSVESGSPTLVPFQMPIPDVL